MHRLGQEMVGAGMPGPVLIVAGTRAIARFACGWAADLDRHRIRHRVRLVGGEPNSSERSSLVDEARSLGARTIVAAGDEVVLEAAWSVAASLGLPFVACPTHGPTDASSGGPPVTSSAASTPRCAPDLVLVDTSSASP